MRKGRQRVSVLFTILTFPVAGVLILPLALLIGKRFLKRECDRLERMLRRTADLIDRTNERIGNAVSWLALLMVLVQTIVVLQRYVFGLSFIWLQESITYMHGILFMLAAGYTLLRGGHVRVDIFYGEATPTRKALIDFLGTYLFLFPVMFLILDMAYPYVEMAWRVQEGSVETSGIQGIYLLKAVILLFASLVLLQGLSLAIRTALVLTSASRIEPETEGPAAAF